MGDAADSRLYFADLSWTDVDELLRSERKTVLLFPLGATEPHGPHSPLRTDPLISHGICIRAARALAADPELRALVLPGLDFGVTRYSGGFPGRIHVSEETLQAVIVDVCTSLAEQGLRHVVLVNSHFEPEHVRTLHRSIDVVHEATGVLVGYLDLTRKKRAARLTDEFRRGECHAGRYETSLVLADRPELVDREAMRALPYVPVNLARVIADGSKDFVEMGLTQAYCGSPAEATAEEGEQTYAVLAGMLVDLARDLVRGVGGRDLPGLFTRV